MACDHFEQEASSKELMTARVSAVAARLELRGLARIDLRHVLHVGQGHRQGLFLIDVGQRSLSGRFTDRSRGRQGGEADEGVLLEGRRSSRQSLMIAILSGWRLLAIPGRIYPQRPSGIIRAIVGLERNLSK